MLEHNGGRPQRHGIATGRLCSRNKLTGDVVGGVTLIINSSQLCSESSRSLGGVWSFRKLKGADLGRRAEPLER